MYKFILETDMSAYDDFIETHGGQYIQCSRWEKVKTTWKCRYYSGFENNERVLCVLVMERSLPAAGKIWYAPSGPVCDYNNHELLKQFTAFISSLVKKEGITAFIMDPPISLRINGETQEYGKKMHKELLSLGYKLNTSIADYTYKQPVQLFIPLVKDGKRLEAKDVLKKCDKGVRYSIRIGEQRGLVAKTYTSKDVDSDPQIIKDFMSVMRDTSERDNFVERDGDYCAKLLREFDGFSDLKLVYYDKQLDRTLQAQRLEKKEKALAELPTAHEKKARQLKEIIDSVDKQTEHFNGRIKEAEEFTSDDTICLAGGLSIYYSDMGSCLFGGTRNVIRNNTRSSHYLNYLRLCESINRGLKIHDLGYVKVNQPEPTVDGTLGELAPQPNFVGIYNFKKSFSADYHEFIGEYVIVGNKAKYFAYSTLMPKAKDIKIALVKKLRK